MYLKGINIQPRLTEIEKIMCKQFSYIDIDRLIALCLHWVGEVLEVSFVITLFFIEIDSPFGVQCLCRWVVILFISIAKNDMDSFY